jgi:hypothetical protein
LLILWGLVVLTWILKLHALRTEITLGNVEGSNGTDEAWNTLHTVVDTLTAGGMSSDESETDEYGRTIFVVKKLSWRDREINHMMRRVDQDHNRTNGMGNRRAGNPPRIRVIRRGARDSMREAVPGLPHNFYNPTWYAGLTNREQRELDAQPAIELPDIVDEDM